MTFSFFFFCTLWETSLHKTVLSHHDLQANILMSQESFAPLPCNWVALVLHSSSNEFRKRINHRKQSLVIKIQVVRVSTIFGSPTLGLRTHQRGNTEYSSPQGQESLKHFVRSFQLLILGTEILRVPGKQACVLVGAIAVVPGWWVGAPGLPRPFEEIGGQSLPP